MRPIWWTAIAIALAASACLPPGNECSVDDDGLLEFTVTGPAHAAAFALHADPADAETRGVNLSVAVSNPTDQDCMVAIYTSSTRPDPAAVPDLVEGETPPETLPTIGARQGFFNLARTYQSPDGDELWARLGSGGRAAADFYATVVTCAAGGITGTVEFWVMYCADNEIRPDRLAPDKPTTTRQQLW